MKESEFYKEAGGRIHNLRDIRGYTRESLAARAGISDKFLYEIETGKKGFTAEILFRIAKALNVSCDYIITGQHTEGHCNEEILRLMEEFSDSQMSKVIKLLEAVREIM